MNILDALKSGKRIRRRGESYFVEVDKHGYYTKEEMLAEDWEVESEIDNKSYILTMTDICHIISMAKRLQRALNIKDRQMELSRELDIAEFIDSLPIVGGSR